MLWTYCPLCNAPLYEPMKPPAGEDTVFTCPECGGLLRLEQDEEQSEAILIAVEPGAKDEFKKLC